MPKDIPSSRIPDLLMGILEDAARTAGCSIPHMLGRTRGHAVASARMAAMAHAYEEGFSSTQIGWAFNRDHTTVLYAAGRLTGRQSKDVHK